MIKRPSPQLKDRASNLPAAVSTSAASSPTPPATSPKVKQSNFSSRHSHWYPCRTCWAGRARRHCCCLRLGADAPTHLCPSHQICPPAKHSNWLQTCFKKIPFVLKIVTINCSSIYHVITSHTYFEMLSLFCSFHLLVKDTRMDGMCCVYWCRHSSTLLLHFWSNSNVHWLWRLWKLEHKRKEKFCYWGQCRLSSKRISSCS